MNTSVLIEPFKIELEQRPIPEPKANEVLIKVMAVGICGSDLHYYEHGRIGQRLVEKPLVQGHECTGVVEAVGKNVSSLKIGDRVAIEPGIPCRECNQCKTGHYNLCPEVRFLSTPPVNGALTEYMTHPEDFTYRIPEGVSYEVASLVEPFSVGIHASELTAIRPGDTVFITGMGPVGLMMVLAAKAYGATRIFVSDVEPYRLKVASELGATSLINALYDDAENKINGETLSEGVDVVIDTTGQEQVLELAVNLLKRGGKIGAVGFPTTDTVRVPLLKMIQKEISLQPVYRYKNTYKKGLDLLAKEAASAQVLITDHYPLSQAVEAFERARTNKSETIKVMVYPSK